MNKVILIGDSNVGKTSLANRFSKDTFENDLQSTIGCSRFDIEIRIDNKPVKFSLWDTAGQEKYRSLIPSYTRDAKIVLLVFDLSYSEPFTQIDKWIKFLREETDEDPSIILIGNKSDLGILLQIDTVQEYCEQILKDRETDDKNLQKISYMITSAKTGEGIPDLINFVGKILLELDQKESVPKQAPVLHSITETDEPRKKKGCCK